MPRLFSGLELPHDIRDSLAALRQPLPGARWIEAANLHLTLRFYGDVDNPTAREIDSTLARIHANAFELQLKGLGSFGSSEVRTIWAGVERSPLLDELAAANERAGRIAGLSPERKKFKPHVTIARFKSTRPEAVARFLQRHGAFRCEPFLVDHFTLFSSKPKTGGGPYVIEETYPLAGYDWAEDDIDETHDHGGDPWPIS
jgi:2'-5' RNA ligase